MYMHEYSYKIGTKILTNTCKTGEVYKQYWCIGGKYRIYVARLRNGGKMSFSESFHPFRAKPHQFYIYRQYTNIVFILQ